MSDCVEFDGWLDAHGYGYVFVGKKTIRAHRLAYAEHNKVSLESLTGKVVMHACDNPSCINPEHLAIGSQADNVADKICKGRQAKGSRHGISKLTESTVLRIFELSELGVPQRKIAAQFGIDQSAISRIVNGKQWAHVAVKN